MTTRRRFLQGLAGLAAGLLLPPTLEENAEDARRFWFGVDLGGSADAKSVECHVTLREAHIAVFGADGRVSVHPAYGDGVHDDSDAIRAAIADAEIFGGGTVSFSPSNFRITEPLTIRASNTVYDGNSAHFLVDADTGLLVPRDTENTLVRNFSMTMMSDSPRAVGARFEA